ncbi:MAG: YggS family pyridoxal phosphate-dependent enzyme [Clostridia bacterium]|nr:YggS family pyridoxal phosphate-dependent enzyme [Deltaproteobacteria bacterium]
MSGLAQRLAAVRASIADAARAAGRAPETVALLAVSKFQPIEALIEAYQNGVRDFGENIVQELAGKASVMANLGFDVRWHLIGRLQKNKINLLLRHAIYRVQTIDSIELADAVAQRTGKPDAKLDIFVQVNIGREAQKGGVDPDAAIALCAHVAATGTLTLCGLMAIPPADAEPSPFFAQMKQLHGNVLAAHPSATEFSLGMSGDYSSAIANGSTMVRIGTAIFGERARGQL